MIGLLMLASSAVAQAGPTVDYQRKDSVEVVQLLTDDTRRTTLDFARYFLGRPYVAHTLDGAYAPGGNGIERLTVNLRGLDCLTLVETSSALALSRRELERGGDDAWHIYCDHLRSLRYFDGHIDGYLSRIHYLTMYIADHVRRGDFEEVVLPERLTRQRTAKIHYMSRHPQAYDALKRVPSLTQQIAALESHYSGEQFRYLPQENCGLSRQQLSAIHDGDIIYIVTSKDGLDYSHQGFAFWGKDGKLHMLHASSDRKRVIEDERPLATYLSRIPASIGIRVFRVK